MKLSTTRLTIPVERDGVATGEIVFDPQDVAFAEGFFALLEGMNEREQKLAALTEAPAAERLAAMGELCRWLREQVEQTFGAGSCQVLFGDSCAPDLFRQFFAGIEPIIRRARSGKLQKHRAADGGVLV